MKKFLLSILLISMCATGFGTIRYINTSGNTFTPATITITVGDTVNFSIGAIHNAVEVSQATWDANGTTALPGFSLPMGGGTVLPSQLAVGTHYYVCTPHASLGMKGIIIVQYSAAIPEVQAKENISIYPNPSVGKFQLVINSAGKANKYRLEIYDALGEKVYSNSGSFILGTNQIDLSDFSKGIYFIKLSDGEEIYDKKIVVW